MSELGFYRFAKKDPSEVAIIGPNEEAISRGDLLKKANQLSHALRKLGLNKGDTVAIVLPNSIEYYIAYMACLQVGFYMVLLTGILRVQRLPTFSKILKQKLSLPQDLIQI